MIVVCGEALIDLVPDRSGRYAAHPGGSPANVAVGLGRLGVDVALLARLASDRFGGLIRDHLTESGVRLDVTVHSGQPSTLAVVHLDPDGTAAYDFYVDGCADGGWELGEVPDPLPGTGALHVSGALALPVPAMGTVVEALMTRERQRRVVTFDPNVRPALVRDETLVRQRLYRWLGLADVVRASAEDIAWIAPGRSVEDVAGQWYTLGPSLVVVTRGPDGVYALGPAGPVDLPGTPVDVVDTVGAGDAFMSGLLAALDLDRPALRGLTTPALAAALGYAGRVAAITCTRAGADPPWRAELSTV